jgi:hypothetical protein
MELCPLEKLQHRIQVGTPLPFTVRDRTRRLLRAKNDVIADAGELAALTDGDAFVDLDEQRGAEVQDAPIAELPALWRKLADQLSRVLGGMPSPQAPQALDDAARYLDALVARAPDLAIFLVVRPDRSQPTRYGVERCLQAAATALLAARRAGWPDERRLTLAKAAFTMNLGMLDLQERLSNQARLPNPAQRQAIHAHPMTSAQTLRDSGVTDAEWLQAVAQHHEVPGGGGYPAALVTVGEMAGALRVADVYTAKLAGRSGRDALLPERALRELLLAERSHPFAQALAAEFGPHPPGTTVRLHNGEIAVVVQRGPEPGTPRVAVVTTPRAQSVAEPFLREAAGIAHGIAAQVDPRSVKTRRSPEQLHAAVTA